MKYSLLFLFLGLISFPLFSQNKTDYSEFRFTIVNAKGDQLTPDNGLKVKIHVIVQDATNFATDNTKIEYSKNDSCWILSQSESRGYLIKISAYFESDPSSTESFMPRSDTLNFTYKTWHMVNQTGCQFCICYNIPFVNKSFYIDMPSQPKSWEFVPVVKSKVSGNEAEFRDISFMQNWFNR